MSAISTFLISSKVPFTRAIRSISAVIVTVRVDWSPASISAICAVARPATVRPITSSMPPRTSTGQAIGLNRLFVANR